MSDKRTAIVIGVLGILLAIPGTIVALNELGTINVFPTVFDDDQGNASEGQSGCGRSEPSEITLSADSAQRGASVTVFGSCFQPGERVELRVHVTVVGSATADSAGSFNQTIKIPESSPPPGFPTSITATGKSSIKSASAPFSTAK